MILTANSYHRRRGKGGPGEQPLENFSNHAFFILGNALCDIERVLQKGHFCSFAEKGRDLYPEGPCPSCTPAVPFKQYLSDIIEVSVYNIFQCSSFFYFIEKQVQLEL